MRAKKNSLVVIFLFFCLSFAFAQKKTELDSVQLSCHAINGEILKSPIDTSLFKFHQYNNALAGSNFFAYTGNIGLAARNAEFTLPNSGFNALPNNFFCWDFSQLPLSYYNTTKPFTKIDVVFGSKKQLISNVLHTQNVNEFTNLGFMINGLRSDGFSTRQQSSSLNSRFFYSYKPTNIRYNAYVNFDWGRIANQENGGIRSDSSSLFLAEADSRLVPTYFANAISNRVGGTFTAIQYFNLGTISKTVKDSVETKKVNTSSKFYYRFSHSDLTNIYSHQLTEPELDVYVNYFEDSLNTKEEIQTKQTQNALGWNNFDKYAKDSSSLFIDVFLQHNYIEFHQKEINSFYNNVSVSADLRKRVLKNHELKLNANLFAGGYNAGDYKFNFGLFKNKSDSTKFAYSVNVFSQLQHPDYIVNRFSSNHFKWTSAFKQQLFNGVTAKVVYAKQAAEISFTSITNFVFYDFNATPSQLNGTISVLSAKLFSDFKLKKINFSNVVLVQKQLNGLDVTRLPFLFSRHTVFLEKILFKKTTPFQAGIEINFNSAYYANAYMPSSSQFYLQNKQQIGGKTNEFYLYKYDESIANIDLVGLPVQIDLFMSFRIKSAKVFVKMERVIKPFSIEGQKNDWNFFSGNNYLVPFHPMHDRAFAAGVSWAFVN